MFKRSLVALLCFLTIAFGVTTVFGLSIEVPRAERLDLGDGLVFWLVRPEGEYWCLEIEYFYDVPEVSGLYRNGELVYTIEVVGRWWLMWNIYFSDDAMTFIRVLDGLNGTIRFYEQGVFVHEHRAGELLQGGRGAILEHECEFSGRWHQWHFRDRLHHNRDENILSITTVEYTRITFDLSTGLILNTRELLPIRESTTEELMAEESEIEEPIAQRNFGIIIAVFAVAICIIILLLITKIKRKA
jgi:hypothetical protein